MLFSIGKFINLKNIYESENILCPIRDYSYDKYLNKRLVIRVLFMILYCFGFGYSIFFHISSFIELRNYIIKFILIYIIFFYIIQFFHELIHVLFYPNLLKNNKIIIKFFNKKRLITNELHSKIKTCMLFFSLIAPFIIFSIFPLIIMLYSKFNIYLYTLSFANAILSSEDLLNIIFAAITESNDGYKKLFILLDSNNNK